MGPSIFWLVAMIAFAAAEGLTVGLTCIWFAVGSLGALFAARLGGPLWLQIAVFVVLSAAALALIRPLAVKLLEAKRTPTNADRVIGCTGQVTQDIDNTCGKGQVNVSGQIWSARSEYGTVIPAGTQVKVLRIEGVKVFVEAE